MPTPPDSDQARLREEAIAWLVRVQSGDLTRGERSELAGWRKRTPANELAWREAEELWLGVEPLRGRSIPGSQPMQRERPVLPLRAICRRRRWSRPWAAASAAAVLAWAVALYPPVRWLADYSTGTGQTQTVSLEDGSTVALNTDTAIRVEFSGNRRNIRLLSGEAVFKVAKDASRPFTVVAEHGSARAVGTEFLVRESDDGLDVAVLEGVVRMETGVLSGQALLTHHQRGSYRQGGTLRVDPSVAVENLTAWREGFITFDNTPLREALTQIDRYRPGEVLLLNEKLAEYRVSGVFRIGDLDQALHALGETTPARLSFLTPYLVLVR